MLDPQPDHLAGAQAAADIDSPIRSPRRQVQESG
jgi:hypothetical protein